jgi:hypothetical protein
MGGKNGAKNGAKKRQHSMRAVFSFWRVLWRRFVKRQKWGQKKTAFHACRFFF